MTLSFASLQRALAFVEHSGTPAGQEALQSLQILSASALAEQYFPQLDPGQPLLVAEVGSRELAERCARVLLAAYPVQHGTALIDAGDDAVRLPLSELGRAQRFGPSACLYVPPLEEPGAYGALQQVVARLRAPDGCPWDRALTWDKLRPFLLEESYELLAALDGGDPAKVAEEQGDLLLQIALQTQIALETGAYRPGDVIRTIVSKLIRRHPHVFGDVEVSGTDEVLANWEAIKRAERENNGQKRSPLAGVPANLPALAQADAYLDRMSRLEEKYVPAAPWADLAEMREGDKLSPEMAGRVLFGLVAWMRARGVEVESALRAENARFASHVERAAEEGR